MWQYVVQAGNIGYVLVGLSVLSCGVIVERLWFWLRRSRRLDERLRRQVIEAFRKGDSERLDALVAGSKSAEANALRFVIEHRDTGSEAALDIALSREVRDTNRWLAILDVNGSISPMLGILGTVTGIIQAFKGMKGATPDTGVMVAGLSVSMLTTAIGLIVALISIIPYNIFASKAHRAQTHLAELLQECWLAWTQGAGTAAAQLAPAEEKPAEPEPEPEQPEDEGE